MKKIILSFVILFVSCKSIELMPNINSTYVIIETSKFEIWISKQYIINNISIAKLAFGSTNDSFMDQEFEILKNHNSNITIKVDDNNIYNLKNNSEKVQAIYVVSTECLRRTHFNINDVKVLDKVSSQWIEYDIIYNTIYGITKIMETKNGEYIFHLDIAV